MRDFRKYQVWIDAVDFSTEVYRITSCFPRNEAYSLTDQLRRASVSISSNIAEGCSRESEKEFLHFVQISLGSAFEVETQLKIAQKVEYITESQYQAILVPLEKLERQ